MTVQETSALAGTVILGIDDQEDNLLFLRSVLESRKATFFGSTSPTECFGLAGRVQPRVVLLDIQMPGMDGFETCRRLRTMREVQDTPIVFLTGRKTVDDVKTGLAAGGNDFIVKPFDPAKLLSRVEYWATRGVRGPR